MESDINVQQDKETGDPVEKLMSTMNRLGMVSPESPHYSAPKRSGLEIALEALRKSKPNSPTIAYLEKQLRKRVDKEGIDGGVSSS